MLLCVDIGNSNIVFGVYDNNKLLTSFRLESSISRTEDELGTLIIACLKQANIKADNINGIIIASVILSMNKVFEKLASKYFKQEAIFVGSNLKSGIIIKIDQPKTLAPDILVGIVGAKQKYGLNCMVIDVGTATTMTIINDNNEYIGGVVYPGLKLSARALASKTSMLPLIDLAIPNQIICKETISAMQSGLMNGYGCMLDGMITKMEAEYGQKLKIIVTGGLSKSLKQVIDHEVVVDEDLILDGLNYLYHKNKESN
jgi:type III pantothenate kinase